MHAWLGSIPFENYIHKTSKVFLVTIILYM